MIARFTEDIQAYLDKDPAATSELEILLCYPGLHAVWCHRVCHFIWKRNWRILARFLSYWPQSARNFVFSAQVVHYQMVAPTAIVALPYIIAFRATS